MRRSPEIVILLGLLLLGIVGVSWYVIDRRASQPATPPVTVSPLRARPVVTRSEAVDSAPPGPVAVPPVGSESVALQPAAANSPGPVPPLDLTKHDGQTIDFSSGQPEVKDSLEDKAALEAGARDLAEATKGVTFAPKKKAGPPPDPPKN